MHSAYCENNFDRCKYSCSLPGEIRKGTLQKLCIVVEEADETVFWLEMMFEASFYLKEKRNRLLKKKKKF